MTRGVLTTKTTKAMKSSGVAWLGDIPDGWEICRLKNVVAIYNGNSIPDSEKIKYEDPINAYPYISSKDIDATFSTANYENGMFTKKEDVLFKIAKAGSVLMCIEGGSAGRKKVLLKKDVSFVNKLACFAPMSIDGRYLFYFLLSPNFEEHFSQNLTGLIGGVSVSSLRNMPILVPNGSEQEAISVYLDEKCGAIDAAIAEAKKGIEEYKLWKKSLIFEAVTGKRRVGAFNAKTQSRREVEKMKPSGIPWIGEIPEGWEKCKTLHALCMPITDGPHTTPDLFDDGIPFVSAEAVSCGNGSIDFDHIRGYISEAFYNECCLKYMPQRDDIYMIKSGATTGRVAIVDTDRVFTIWSPLAVFRCNQQRAKPRYLFYYLQSSAYQGQVELAWSFGTQQNIGMRALEELKVVLPPLPEQQAIADYLDEKCAAIDAMVAEKEALIADLEVYKKSLIYETVTGKREVA